MKRRDFIQNSFSGVMAPIFLNSLGLRSLSGTVQPASTCSYDDRVLVIIYLAGANDIINTTVPLNHLGRYQTLRPSLALNTNNLLDLNINVDDALQIGLNPQLSELKSLYDQEKMAIVQRVGYPSLNRSHFASEDIILKGIQGSPSAAGINDGWVGRFLKDKHPTYKGLPFGNLLDPLGIILGEMPDTGFHTIDEHDMEINLSGQDPAGFFSVLSSLSGEPISQFPMSNHGDQLQYLSLVEKSTQIYSERIQEVFNLGTNSINYDNNGVNYGLADQLKTIARFISGGSTTKVYMARIGGWDTHVSQLGKHDGLLKEISFSINKFIEDLSGLSVSQKVNTVVFSEFGRKLKQNGNAGTDHGTLSSMFVFGDNLNFDHSESGTYNADYIADKGIFGANHSLALNDMLGGNDNDGAAALSQLQHDYRSVFASILKDWLGASPTSLSAAFPNTAQNILDRNIPLILPDNAVDSSCYYVQTQAASISLGIKVYLEGYYDETTGLMSTVLNDNNYLPTEQPFDNNFFNYYGEETVDSFDENIVDWVLLELYDANGLLKYRTPALLTKDGDVKAIDSSTNTIQISDLHPERHYVAILHRSHLGVIASTAIDVVDQGSFQVDLSQGEASAQGLGQLNEISPGIYGMMAGDMDQNGTINTADLNLWQRTVGAVGYQESDLKLDGKVDALDYALWEENRSKLGYPVLHKNLKY